MASLEARAATLAKDARDADLHSGKGAKQGDAESKYRGTWNYASRTPTFNAFQFLPTPPPQKPRTKPPVVEECEEAVAALSIGEAATVEEPVEELEQGELLEDPPADADVMCTIRDRNGKYRGYIANDGECRNNRNTLLGFINADSGQCGTADEEYLGGISEQSAFNDAECIIEDALDEQCGLLDMGTGYLKDFNDRIVAELSHNGVCTGHSGSYLGEFEGFSFNQMKVVGLYLMLVDPGMLNEIEG